MRAIKNLKGKVGRIPASILKCWREVGGKFLRTFQEIPNPRQVFSCFFDGTWNFRFSDVVMHNNKPFLRKKNIVITADRYYQHSWLLTSSDAFVRYADSGLRNFAIVINGMCLTLSASRQLIQLSFVAMRKDGISFLTTWKYWSLSLGKVDAAGMHTQGKMLKY